MRVTLSAAISKDGSYRRYMAHVHEQDWLQHPDARPPARWLRVTLVLFLLLLLAAAAIVGFRLMSL